MQLIFLTPIFITIPILAFILKLIILFVLILILILKHFVILLLVLYLILTTFKFKAAFIPILPTLFFIIFPFTILIIKHLSIPASLFALTLI